MTYHRTSKSAYSVYFARAGDMMKIGCSVNPEQRLPQIAEWVPFKTRLVAVVRGAFDLEADLHAYFAESWSHLEWFHITPEMEALVESVNRGEMPAIPKCPRDAGKELAKTQKKRASRRVTMAENGAFGWLPYPERRARRPEYLNVALESYEGAQNPPPTREALAAIERYERHCAAFPPEKAA